MGRDADLQSLALLGLINSSIITLYEADMVPELRPTLAYGRVQMERLINSFPIRWNESKGWWEGVMKRINARVNDGPDYTAHGVTLFGAMICVDLLEELTDPWKRDIVTEAWEIIKAVDDHLDPTGDQFETYEEIGPLLDDIYSEVGFSRQGRYLIHQEKLKRRVKRNGKGQRCPGLRPNAA